MPTIDAFIIDSLRRRGGRARPHPEGMGLPKERPASDEDGGRDGLPPEPPEPPDPRPRGVVVIDV